MSTHVSVAYWIDMGAYQTKLGMYGASLLNIDDTNVTDHRNTEGTATPTSL